MKIIPKLLLEEDLFAEFMKMHRNVKSRMTADESRDLTAVETLQLKFLSNRWAFWLDSMSDQINQIQLIGSKRIFEDFNEKFLSKYENMSETLFLYAETPIEFTTLGKLYERQDCLIDAVECYDKALSVSAGGKSWGSEVGHYYKSACLIKQDGRNNRCSALGHLKKAKSLLEEQHNEHLSQSQVVKYISDTRSKSGVGQSSNKFQKQIENKCKIIQIHLSAIDEAIGTPLDTEGISNWSCLAVGTEKQEAVDLFEHFLKKGIVKDYALNKTVKVFDSPMSLRVSKFGKEAEVTDWTPFLVPYKSVIIGKIQAILKDKGPGCVFRRDTFEDVIMTQENYWNQLKGEKVIVELPDQEYWTVSNMLKDEDEVKGCLLELQLDESLLQEVADTIIGLKGKEITLEAFIDVKNLDAESIFNKLKPKLLQKKVRRTGTLSPEVSEQIVWDMWTKSFKWKDENNKFAKHVQFSSASHNWTDLFWRLIHDNEHVDEAEDEEIDSGKVSPQDRRPLKKILRSSDIPLFESKTNGSSHVWSFLKSVDVIANAKVQFTSEHAKDEDSITIRLEDIANCIQTENTKLTNIFRKYYSKPVVQEETQHSDEGKIEAVINFVVSSSKYAWDKGSEWVSGTQEEKDFESYCSGLNNSLVQSIGTLKTVSHCKVDYKNLFEDGFKNQEAPLDEIVEMEERGFSDIIFFKETSKSFNWGAVIVGFIGVVQIMFGVGLLFCTFGGASILSAALINEGLSDILFAVESGVSGSFSWKSYGYHKSISLSITILSAGIGAYLARGTQAVQAARTATGLWPFLKTTVSIVGRRLADYAAFAVSNAIIDKVLRVVQTCLLELFGSVIKSVFSLFGWDSVKEKFKTAANGLWDICTKKGEALRIFKTVVPKMAAFFHNGGVLSQFQSYASRIGNSIASSLGDSVSRIFSHGSTLAENTTLNQGGQGSGFIQKAMRVKKWVDRILKTIKLFNMINPVVQSRLCNLLFNYWSTFTGKVTTEKEKVETATAKVNGEVSHPRSDKEQAEFYKERDEVVTNTENLIIDSMTSIIKDGLIQPHLSSMLSRTLQSVGSSAVKLCTSYVSSVFTRNQIENGNAKTDELQSHGPIQPTDTVTNSNNKTVEQLKEVYGDSATFVRDKNGEIHIDRPSLPEFLESMASGTVKRGGFLQLMALANMNDRPIEVTDMDGKTTTYNPKGVASENPPIRLQFDRALAHYRPMVQNDEGAWVPIPEEAELKQGGKLDDNCLWQSAAFALAYKGGSIDHAKTSAESETTISKLKSDFTQYASTSKTFKLMYKSGVSEIGLQYMGGAAMPRYDKYSLTKEQYNRLVDIFTEYNKSDDKSLTNPVEFAKSMIETESLSTKGADKGYIMVLSDKGTHQFTLAEIIEDGTASYQRNTVIAGKTLSADLATPKGAPFSKNIEQEVGPRPEISQGTQRGTAGYMEMSHGIGRDFRGLSTKHNIVWESAQMNRNVGLPKELQKNSHYQLERDTIKFLSEQPNRSAFSVHVYGYDNPTSRIVNQHSYKHMLCGNEEIKILKGSMTYPLPTL